MSTLFKQKAQQLLSSLKHVTLARMSFFLALLTCFLYIPFFRFVVENVNLSTFNGWVILLSLALIVPVATYWVYYLLLFLGRIVGKIILATTLTINATCFYFMLNYHTLMDESMMSNVFNTRYSETSAYFSVVLALYILILGILPSVYLFWANIDYGKWKRMGRTTGISVLFLLIMVFSNAQNWTWIDKQAPQLGALTLPWSYIVNTVRLFKHKAERNKPEIILPDAVVNDSTKRVFVLVIGESARRDHFSLYGYDKLTNPLLAHDSLHTYMAHSAATYTTASVKAILQHTPSRELYEILPNYLERNGCYVEWRTTNWGEPPLHIAKRFDRDALAPFASKDVVPYDGVLLASLRESIENSSAQKVFIVLHTSTSHGPQYSQRYPASFEKFSPVCNSVELSTCSQEELLNAYDNTIVYVDYLLHSVIDTLRSLPDYQSAMLYVSDHGESLGEKNLYLHGVPMSIAPKEQYEVPFLVWTSDNASLRCRDLPEVTQYYVYHSAMHFLSLESPFFDAELSVFGE